MDTGGGLWGVAVIVGPILLAIVVIWALTHNRTSRQQERDTEEATRRMYDEQGAEDRLRDDD